MPAAIALAQEAEAANDRCAYAASLVKFTSEKESRQKIGSQPSQKSGNGQ